MKTFRALCLAAAMALLVTCAMPQGRGRGHDDRGGGGSPPPTKNDGGGQGRGNDNRGNDNRGTPPPVKNDDQRGRGNDNRGTPPPVKNDDQRGRGNDNRGNDNRGTPPPVKNDDQRGRGNDNRGNDNRGGGGAPPPVKNDDQRGRGNDNRGNDNRGNGNPPVRNDDQRGRGNNDRGGGVTPPVRGNDQNGGPTRGGDSRGDTRGGDTRGNGGGPIRGNDGRNGNSGVVPPSHYTGPSRGGDSIVRTDGRFNDSALDQKNSRSGRSHYDGSHNVRTITKVGSATVIGPAPRRVSDLKHHLITREEQVRLNVGGFRVGYYFYDSRWCDDYFWYPFYTSDPWSYHCVVSPWYYYPMLPGYVRYDRCRFYRLDPWSAWIGASYQWSRPEYYGNYDIWGRRGSDIDYAVDDIVNAFQRADRRAADRLIPTSSEVAIYIDGDYSYTLGAEDFYDMFMDATQNTKTIRYTIERVERGRDNYRDTVRVTARHEYEDPWGMRSVVTHYYELRYEGRNLVISKFGVSGG